MNKRVDIVKVKNPSDFFPSQHHAVEEETTLRILFECDTQKEADQWASDCGFKVNLHRERNRQPKDKHGQYRKR